MAENVARVQKPKDFMSVGLRVRLYFECTNSAVPKRATGPAASIICSRH